MATITVKPIKDGALSFFNLKPKEKVSYRISTWYNSFMDSLISMFDYTIDEEANPYFDSTILEKLLITEGEAGIAKTENDGIVVGHFSFDGDHLDYNGRLNRGKVICLNGKQFSGEIGKEIIWVWNNNNHEYDRNLSRFATVLSDIDLSFTYNIKYSRNCPIPVAKNSKIKKSLTAALDKIFDDGKMEVVIDDIQGVNEIMGKSDNKVDIVNLTDVANSDKLQNLCLIRDFFITSISRFYGISLTGNGKKAQQSVDEIQGYSQFSAVQPMIRLKHRKKACEQIKKNFGVEISVDFAKPWKMMSESIEVDTDEDIDDDGKIGVEGVNEDEIKED